MPAKFSACLWVPTEGTLEKFDRLQIADRIKAWAGMRLRITLDSPPRTIAQNAYYWACYVQVIAQAMRDAGGTAQEDHVHEWLARKFLPFKIHTMPDGSEVIERTSTRDLTTKEFTEYIDNIRMYEPIRRLNIHFESPNAYQRRTGTEIKQ